MAQLSVIIVVQTSSYAFLQLASTVINGMSVSFEIHGKKISLSTFLLNEIECASSCHFLVVCVMKKQRHC